MSDQISIESILRPEGAPFAANILPAVYDANLAFARSAAHVEAAFRKLHAAYSRVAAGTGTAEDAVDSNLYSFLLMMGPSVASRISMFEAPVEKKARDERIDAMRFVKKVVGSQMLAGLLANAASVAQTIRSGKATIDGETLVARDYDWSGLKEDGSNLLDWVLDHQGSPEFRTSVGPEFAPRSEARKAKAQTTQLSVGWYAEPWRGAGKAKEEEQAPEPQPTNGAAPAPTTDAPVGA